MSQKQSDPKVSTKPLALVPKPLEVYDPKDITKNDFFRMRREAQGWIVEMVRLEGEQVVFRRDVWAWDVKSNVENRLMMLSEQAELKR